jgi:hypothetical protein
MVQVDRPWEVFCRFLACRAVMLAAMFLLPGRSFTVLFSATLVAMLGRSPRVSFFLLLIAGLSVSLKHVSHAAVLAIRHALKHLEHVILGRVTLGMPDEIVLPTGKIDPR